MKHLINSFYILKSACDSNKEFALLSNTKLILNLIKILYNEGYISSYVIFQNKIKVYFKYDTGSNVLTSIECISFPSKLTFWSYSQLRKICSRNSSNTYIISNSYEGITTSSKCLRSKHGGLIIAKI